MAVSTAVLNREVVLAFADVLSYPHSPIGECVRVCQELARGESDETTILRAGRIACSWREQILRDTPDFRPVPQLIQRGAVPESAFLDLYDVVVDPALRRPGPETITAFLSQGVGLWDAALGGWVYERAIARKVGQELSLAGEMATPAGDGRNA